MRWLCLFIVLAAASAFSQSDIPSRRVSHTDALVNIAPSNTSLKAFVDWVDGNWPTNIDLDTVYWTSTDQATYETGAASKAWTSDNFLPGTNMVGVAYNPTSKTWAVDWDAHDWDAHLSVLDYLVATNSAGWQSYPDITGVTTSTIDTTTALITNNWVVSESSGRGLLGFTNGVLHSPSNTLLLLNGEAQLRIRTNTQPVIMLRFYEVGADAADRIDFGGVLGEYRYDDDDPAINYRAAARAVVRASTSSSLYTAPAVSSKFVVPGVSLESYRIKWNEITAILFVKPGE